MSNKRFWVPLLILVSTFFVLTPFQNCSTAPRLKRAESDPLRSFETASENQFLFHQAKWVASDSARAIRLEGACSKDFSGSRLQWSLQSDDLAAQALETGEASCHNGRFDFQVALSEDVICDLDHVVVVKSDWGASIQSVIAKRCQPLASAKVSPSEGLANADCELNYNLKSNSPGERECSRLCFQSGRLVSEELRPASDCQPLASTLSGPSAGSP